MGKIDIVISKNKVPIRLTKERWFHITEEHSEMVGYYFEVLDTVENLNVVYSGKKGEYLAVSEIEPQKYIIVIYKEISKKDGFIITAFFTRQKKQLERRKKYGNERNKTYITYYSRNIINALYKYLDKL